MLTWRLSFCSDVFILVWSMNEGLRQLLNYCYVEPHMTYEYLASLALSCGLVIIDNLYSVVLLFTCSSWQQTNFRTACKNSTKLHTTFFQHVFNRFVNFQSKRTTNVEMTFALKLGVKKCNIVDTSNIGCVWHALCMVYCWNNKGPGLSMVPNCHNCHLRYNLNRFIAKLSSCSDSNVQQNWACRKRVVLITMALIATSGF